MRKNKDVVCLKISLVFFWIFFSFIPVFFLPFFLVFLQCLLSKLFFNKYLPSFYQAIFPLTFYFLSASSSPALPPCLSLPTILVQFLVSPLESKRCIRMFRCQFRLYNYVPTYTSQPYTISLLLILNNSYTLIVFLVLISKRFVDFCCNLSKWRLISFLLSLSFHFVGESICYEPRMRLPAKISIVAQECYEDEIN